MTVLLGARDEQAREKAAAELGGGYFNDDGALPW